MEIGYIIIICISMLIELGLMVTFIWLFASNESIPSLLTNLVLSAILSTISIPRLVLEIMIGGHYIFTIVILVLSVAYAIYNGHSLDRKKEKQLCCTDWKDEIPKVDSKASVL